MKKILIVDDDPGIRLLLDELLSAEGHTITTKCDGREAFHHLQHHQEWDALILDNNMPIMDGLELLRRLKTMQTRIKRVILITGNIDGVGNVADLKAETPAFHLLEKPFSIEHLLEVIK